MRQLISSEKFTNIQKAQAGLTRLFEDAANTDTFSWFANLGMLFMIFSIIFQMKGSKHKQDKALGKYLIKKGLL